MVTYVGQRHFLEGHHTHPKRQGPAFQSLWDLICASTVRKQ